jgi:hypothetical protein
MVVKVVVVVVVVMMYEALLAVVKEDRVWQEWFLEEVFRELWEVWAWVQPTLSLGVLWLEGRLVQAPVG